MKRGLILMATMLIIAIVFITATYFIPGREPQEMKLYTDVTASEAKALIESNPETVILDVRSYMEYREEHIPGAYNIPLYQLEHRIVELNKEDEILVYCVIGIISEDASEVLVKNNFTKVYNMVGGIRAWKRAGYPTE